MEKRQKLRINLKIGTLTFTPLKSFFPTTNCNRCRQEIYWIKTLGHKKMPTTKISDEEYTLHSLVCPEVAKHKERKFFQKVNRMAKKYKWRKKNETNKAIKGRR